MGSRRHLWFLHAKTETFGPELQSLYWSQTSPVDLCMQNSVLTTRINSLYGSQTSSVVLAYKTDTFAPELQFFVGPRTQLSFFACKTA